MIEKAKRTIALNNPYYRLVVVYDNERPYMGTPFSSELMDEISSKAGDLVDNIIVEHLKKMHEEKANDTPKESYRFDGENEPYPF